MNKDKNNKTLKNGYLIIKEINVILPGVYQTYDKKYYADGNITRENMKMLDTSNIIFKK